MWSDQEKKIQKIDRLARSLLIQGLSNDIYSLINSNKTAKDLWDALARQMIGSEYGEQDRKATVLYKYETFKATEVELLLDTYILYLHVINDLKKCGYSKDNYELNFKFLNNLQPEWKQSQGLMSCNNSHLKDTRSAFVCNNSRNASCNAGMNAYDDVNDLFVFDDHMMGNRALLTNFVEKFIGMVRFGNNDFAVIAGYGNGLEVTFRKSACFVRNENGKIHRKHHKSKTAFASNKPLYLLHMDLCGLMRVESINEKRYVLVVVDDYSWYTWGFFLHSKDEAYEVIISFIKKTQVNLQLQVQRVRTDNGTEFKTKLLLNSLTSIEPANVAEALKDIDWVIAMQDELDQFARLKSENDCQVVENVCDDLKNPNVIALGMFKLNVSQNVSPISASKTSCASNNVKKKTKRKRRNRNSSKQYDKQVNKDVLRANKAFVHFLDLDTFSSVRRPKVSSVVWKKKGSTNTSRVNLSYVNHSNVNKNVKRYSLKNLMLYNNSNLGDTRSAHACNHARNAYCNATMNAYDDVNDLFVFDDVILRKSQVSKMPFRKNPHASLNMHSRSKLNTSLPRNVFKWLPKMKPLAKLVAKWIPRVKRQID
nr:ribonuclease H-like domain-containing protein [Tanacetum cinerariifolium]